MEKIFKSTPLKISKENIEKVCGIGRVCLEAVLVGRLEDGADYLMQAL